MRAIDIDPDVTSTRQGSEQPERLSQSSARLVALTIAVLLVGINMRPAIVAVSPVLDDIRSDTGISNGVAGILTTLPLICFGIFAPLAPRLARRFGIEATLVGVLVLLLAGIALRLVPDLGSLFAGTFLVGTSVAVANVVVTAVIKRDFGHRVGLMSGLHTTMLVGGAAIAGGVTEPLGSALDLSWRQAISVWGVLVLIAILAWLPRSVRTQAHETQMDPASKASVWRSRLAWNVALFYAFQSFIYYTSTTWLPSFYVAHGYSQSHAGVLLAVCFGSGVITAVTVPLFAEKLARQSSFAIGGGLLCAAALLGLILAPTAAAVLWAILLGLGLGDVLSLGIAYMSMRAASHQQAGQISAMSQCVGYLVAAVGPATFGLTRDLTDSWNPGLVALIVLIVPMTLTGVFAGRGGHVHADKPQETPA